MFKPFKRFEVLFIFFVAALLSLLITFQFSQCVDLQEQLKINSWQEFTDCINSSRRMPLYFVFLFSKIITDFIFGNQKLLDKAYVLFFLINFAFISLIIFAFATSYKRKSKKK